MRPSEAKVKAHWKKRSLDMEEYVRMQDRIRADYRELIEPPSASENLMPAMNDEAVEVQHPRTKDMFKPLP